jgi:hypothetical protein
MKQKQKREHGRTPGFVPLGDGEDEGRKRGQRGGFQKIYMKKYIRKRS